ncbi:MAG: hypothetical protein IKU37_01215 [Candidatus Gastranaerophilales bacterium]|nr:hypothetical protein [Candidatus Gastranaerophilales bacterium]
MGKIKKYIDMIVDNGKREEMECLSDMLSDVIYMLKDEHYDKYEKYKMKLYGMAYGYQFNEDMAHEIVEDMKPLGEYWDMKTTTSVKNQYSINVDDCTFYVVMNSLVNDYHDAINPEEVETYVKMAYAFINDEDAKRDKVWKYFTTIPNRD